MAELNARATMSNVLSARATLSQVVQGGGSAATGNATVDQVLAGATFSNADDIDLTGTMPNIGKEDFTPTTTNQTISAGYHDGTGVVSGDADLIADNIKTGVSIFGVAGNVVPEDLSPYKTALDAANEEASADLTAGIAFVDNIYADIKAAITAKGVDMAGVKPSGYDSKISELTKLEGYPIDTTGINILAWFDPTVNAVVSGAGIVSITSRGVDNFKKTALAPIASTTWPASAEIGGLQMPLYNDGARASDFHYAHIFVPASITIFQVLRPNVEPNTRTYLLPLRWQTYGYITAGGSTASLEQKYCMNVQNAGTLIKSSKVAANGVTAVVSATIADNDQKIWVNGGNNGTATNASPVTGSDFIIGSFTVATFRFSGNIGDTIICSGVLSDADRIRIEDYLMTKWSVVSERP